MFMRRLATVCSLISLSLLILVNILFCFEMKAWGFSQIELAIIFVVCVAICWFCASVVVNHQKVTSTLFLVTIVMMLLTVVQLMSITFVDEAIRTFFLL